MVSSKLKYAGIAVGALLALLVGGFVLGVFGVPGVDDVENRFAGVNETTTTIESNVTVDNPNPVDVTFGGVDLNYEIAMNEVPMAFGEREGVSVGAGTSTVPLETQLRNENIPEWWVTHIDRGETTEVGIDVDLSHGALGGRSVTIDQEETIETNILAGFNSTEPRPIDANRPLIDDPVLYLNETVGVFGDGVTDEETPIEKSFTFYNPKDWPYTVTEVGYEVTMNDVPVGEGQTDRATVISPGDTETIEADTAIHNQLLDDWWVTHIERNEVTDLEIDFYIIVDPDPTGLSNIDTIRLDTDQFDHETVIETDIFGTKPDTAPDHDADGDAETDDDSGEETDGADEDEETDDGDETDEEDDGSDEEENGDSGDDEEDDGDNEEDDDDGIIGDDTLTLSPAN